MRPSTSTRFGLCAVFVLVAAAAGCGPASPPSSGGPPVVTTVAAPDPGVTVVTAPPTTESAAPPTTLAAAPTTAAPASLDWGACEDDGVPADAECAVLAVPLDHADPAGAVVELALVRLPAAGTRIGSLLFNPGGPGASGVDFVTGEVAAIRDRLWPDLVEGFDLVGFDPRGVGGSGALRCLDDADLETYAYLDPTPDTDEERRLLDAAPAFDEACRARYGDALRFYDTVSAARDMDLVRRALGDEQVSFYGASYGTLLGAVYASLHPDRVRVFVLDGAYDPVGQDAADIARTRLVALEAAFERWVTWCETTPGCPFRAEDVDGRWVALRSALDLTSIAASDGRTVNAEVLDTATVAALYERSAWPLLAGAAAAAERGDGTGLLALADAYLGRRSDGTWATDQQANAVISCASGLEGAVPQDPGVAAGDLRRLAPHFGGGLRASDLVDPCGALPTGSIGSLDYAGTGPILVIGGADDPITPLAWAERLTAALGGTASLLRYTGEGHVAFFDSACVRDAASRLLLAPTSPAVTVPCAADPDVPRPSWFDALPAVAGIDPVDLLGALAVVAPTTQSYAESATTSLDAVAAADLLVAAYRAAGLDVVDRTAVDMVEGVTFERLVIRTASGRTAVTLVLGPDALAADPFLAVLRTLLPEDASLVVTVATA